MMFRRRSRVDDEVRALLKLVDQQQQVIRDLTDRLMFQSGQMWTPPPAAAVVDDRDPYQRPAWTPSPEQEPMH